MTAHRLAAALCAKWGKLEAFWRVNLRVRGWVVDGSDPSRVIKWRAIRAAVYDHPFTLGRTTRLTFWTEVCRALDTEPSHVC